MSAHASSSVPICKNADLCIKGYVLYVILFVNWGLYVDMGLPFNHLQAYDSLMTYIFW